MFQNMAIITKESFESAVDLLINASPKSNSKGKALIKWISDNFNSKARVSLTTGAALGNRVGEQFGYKAPVVIFVCKDDVNVDALVSYINARVYPELDTLLIMSASKPYTYFRLYARTETPISKWMELNLNIIQNPISYNNQLEDRPNINIHNNMAGDIQLKVGAIEYSQQTIFYGAPGTGKSYKTNEVAKKYSTIRTTFHPDSDYSTFVGTYKPITTKEDRYGLNGTNTVALKYPDGSHVGEIIKDSKITYRFVKQAFLKAYVQAWKLFRESESIEDVDPQFLVIEEINRGNCAQIFGDLFQLLDRKNGFSEYPIEADEDISKSLTAEDTDKDPSFGEKGLQFTDSQKEVINAVFNKDEDAPYRDVASEIAVGKVLVLPPNLYIWATMNTSDQSLFPIDSAFKRRWDWKYVRICEGKKKDGITQLNYRIKFVVPAKGEKAAELVDESWWTFVKAINKQIEIATKSEDKKLGYFFCKPDKKEDGEEESTIISAETFVGKVVFYLWQDVFKDYGNRNNIFKSEGISFHDFYPEDMVANKDTNPDGIDLELVKSFIKKVLDGNKEQPKTLAEE